MGSVWLELRTLCSGVFEARSETRSPDLAVDAWVAVVFTGVLFAVNWGVRLWLVAPAARRLLRAPRQSRLALEAKTVRFSQSAMELFFYSSFSMLGLFVVPRQPWIWPSKHWWIDFATGAHAEMRDDLRCYYLLYGARYVQGMISVLLEPRRKDFVEMQLHHVVTVAVVAISYLYGWNRVGAAVMLLLDPADVPLHTAKMIKYVGDAHEHYDAKLKARCSFWADRSFEIFAALFFVTRVAAFPYVCWSAHVEATRYFPKGLPEWTCVACLETLYALQCYWFFLIIKVAVRMARTGQAEDVRSDDEHDGPDAHADSTRDPKKD